MKFNDITAPAFFYCFQVLPAWYYSTRTLKTYFPCSTWVTGTRQENILLVATVLLILVVLALPEVSGVRVAVDVVQVGVQPLLQLSVIPLVPAVGHVYEINKIEATTKQGCPQQVPVPSYLPPNHDVAPSKPIS